MLDNIYCRASRASSHPQHNTPQQIAETRPKDNLIWMGSGHTTGVDQKTVTRITIYWSPTKEAFVYAVDINKPSNIVAKIGMDMFKKSRRPI